jgi:hypothetical protein
LSTSQPVADGTEEEYIARVEPRIESRIRAERAVAAGFSPLHVATLTAQHSIFRTTNHDYGSATVTEYEHPPTYRIVTHKFTEWQHLGLNFEHGGFNL